MQEAVVVVVVPVPAAAEEFQELGWVRLVAAMTMEWAHRGDDRVLASLAQVARVQT